MFIVGANVLLPPVPVLITCLLGFTGMLANAVPITPGGLGVGEAAFEGLFALVGVAGGATLLFLWRVGVVPVAVLGAILYLMGVRRAGRTALDPATSPPEVARATR
jgi:uncharacterized membrane protein YbhN (UPF0104 family)